MIIFISGSLKSGKSATAKELAKLIPRPAILEPDIFHGFFPDVPIDQAVPVILEMTIQAIKIFNKNKFNVIVPYPLSEKNYKHIRPRLKGMHKYFFVLNPDLSVIAKGRGRRVLTQWEKARIKHHYEINLNNPSFGINIDNSRKSPKATARLILEKVS